MTVKFNNGYPVIICDICRVIIKPYTPDEDGKEHICDKCKKSEEV